MDDVGDDHRESPHPKILENQNPAILTNFVQNGTLFLQQYGWFIVFGVLLLLYLKSKFGSKIATMTDTVAQMKKNDNYDPDKIRRRQENMEKARRELQEKYDQQAAKHAEDQAKKEEEKRKAKIEDWDNHLQGKGYRSKVYKPGEASSSSSSGSTSSSSSGTKSKNVYRQTDYSPLMGGGGGGGGFRPPRRTGGTRGGG